MMAKMTQEFDTWHHQPEFSELVAESTKHVLAARQYPTKPGATKQPNDQDRAFWSGAYEWYLAARAESELISRLEATWRQADAKQTALYAAEYYLQSGNPLEANRIFEHGRQISSDAPMSSRYRLDLKDVRNRLKNKMKRWEKFRRAATRETDFSGRGTEIVQMPIGRALEGAREFPGIGLTFYPLYTYYAARGHVDLALEYSRRARQFDKRMQGLAGLEAVHLMDRGELKEATLLLDEAIEWQPDNPQFKLLRVVAMCRLMRDQENWSAQGINRALSALPTIQMVANGEPVDAWCFRVLLITLLRQQHRIDEATVELEQLKATKSPDFGFRVPASLDGWDLQKALEFVAAVTQSTVQNQTPPMVTDNGSGFPEKL